MEGISSIGYNPNICSQVQVPYPVQQLAPAPYYPNPVIIQQEAPKESHFFKNLAIITSLGLSTAMFFMSPGKGKDSFFKIVKENVLKNDLVQKFIKNVKNFKTKLFAQNGVPATNNLGSSGKTIIAGSGDSFSTTTQQLALPPHTDEAGIAEKALATISNFISCMKNTVVNLTNK